MTRANLVMVVAVLTWGGVAAVGIEPSHPVATHAAQTVLKFAGIQLTTTVGNS